MEVFRTLADVVSGWADAEEELRRLVMRVFGWGADVEADVEVSGIGVRERCERDRVRVLSIMEKM